MTNAEQLGALARLERILRLAGIDAWLFGGWAVDFHVGSETRPHDDIDLAVWLDDEKRLALLLADDRWEHEEDGDGYRGYRRGAVRLEVAFLERGGDGRVSTPTQSGSAFWPDGAFADDVAEVGGVRARVMSLQALREDKSQPHGDPDVAAKDRADLAALARAGPSPP